MALDVWFAQDVRRILDGISEAFASTHKASGKTNVEYYEGAMMALYAVAKAFGVNEQGGKGR